MVFRPTPMKDGEEPSSEQRVYLTWLMLRIVEYVASYYTKAQTTVVITTIYTIARRAGVPYVGRTPVAMREDCRRMLNNILDVEA